jgi:hypothetical protein
MRVYAYVCCVLVVACVTAKGWLDSNNVGRGSKIRLSVYLSWSASA